MDADTTLSSQNLDGFVEDIMSTIATLQLPQIFLLDGMRTVINDLFSHTEVDTVEASSSPLCDAHHRKSDWSVMSYLERHTLSMLRVSYYVPRPLTSTPFSPHRFLPDELIPPLVQIYIKQLEQGYCDFYTIEPNESISSHNRHIKTMDTNGKIIIAGDGNPRSSAVGYVWKQLSDYPIVCGITQAYRADHKPHYHSEAECYYVVKGRAKTLSQDKYVWLEQGDYLYIPPNAIHNTPITEEGGFSVLYWYPFDSHFDTFKYYWREDVQCCNHAVRAFQKVDSIRAHEMQLGPYGTNAELFSGLC